MVRLKPALRFMMWSLLLVLLGACGSGSESESKEITLLDEPYERTEFLMGTYVTVRIYDEGKEAVLDRAFARVEELADKITTTDEEMTSEVDAVNAAAGQEPVAVSADVYYLIEEAVKYSEDAGFDLTIGAITDLWRIGFDDARKPSQEEIDEALQHVDHEKVQLDAENQTVFLEEEEMKIDLGAIAKGYITDEVTKVLEEEGVTTAIVDLGGNVFVMGGSPVRDGENWNVGIQDPLAERGLTIGKITAKNQSIVTSGIYERYIEVDGVVYHHLMNPETGYPFDNEIAGVSIISDKSIDGDGLSTLVFSLGLEEGLAYVEDLADTEAVFVTKDKEVYVTQGLKENFELTNDDYTWVNQ